MRASRFGFRATIIPIALLLALALPAVSAANVPKFDYRAPSIVPGESIGGVEVGMTKNEAKVAWGAPDGCFTYHGTTTCQYIDSGVINGFSQKFYFADFEVKGGRVTSVQVAVAGQAADTAKVKRLKTARGIKVGSAMSAVRQKYDIPPKGGGEAGLSKALLKKGKRCTQFYAPAQPYTEITSITLGICGSTSLLFRQT